MRVFRFIEKPSVWAGDPDPFRIPVVLSRESIAVERG
jgi:hypothetical protein